MRDHEAAMCVYIRLAIVCDQKKQPQVRDRFLLLGSVQACRAGWPEVADRCRQRLIESNKAHQAAQFATMADALRNEDFQQLVAHWERYCPFEKAEAMFKELKLPVTSNSASVSVGDEMLGLLQT